MIIFEQKKLNTFIFQLKINTFRLSIDLKFSFLSYFEFFKVNKTKSLTLCQISLATSFKIPNKFN